MDRGRGDLERTRRRIGDLEFRLIGDRLLLSLRLRLSAKRSGVLRTGECRARISLSTFFLVPSSLMGIGCNPKPAGACKSGFLLFAKTCLKSLSGLIVDSASLKSSLECLEMTVRRSAESSNFLDLDAITLHKARLNSSS